MNTVFALVYLQLRTSQNMALAQLRRLKKPKYLAGALLGAAYMFFFFVRPMIHRSPGNPMPFSDSTPLGADVQLLAEFVATLGLGVFVLFSWVLPKGRASLDFSETEIAFLFPAPLTRRTLIHFKLLRSQVRLLFSAMFMTLFTGQFAGTGPFWTHTVGWWAVMATLDLHTLGASFVLTFLLDRGVSPLRRRAVVLGGVTAVVCLILWWVRAHLPPLDLKALLDLNSVANYARGLMAQGPVLAALFPFRLLLAPLLAPDVGQFVIVLPPALCILGLHYVWVARSNVAFEEATLAKAQEKARMIAAVRSGNWHLARAANKPVSAPFRLQPSGPRAVALLWKNLISAERAFSMRFWIVLGAGLLIGGAVFRVLVPDSAYLKALGVIVIGLGPMVFLVGPQIVMLDLRQDLAVMDMLKTYPLPGWQVVLGEALAPALLLTGAQWCMVVLAVMTFPDSARAMGDRVAVGLAAVILAPAVNMVSLLILNGAALLFPAWTRVGPGSAQGFEAMGSRMLLMLGHLLSLVLALALPGGVFALIVFVGKSWVGLGVLLPAAAVVAVGLLGVEIAIGLKMLGDLFERFNLSDESF